MGVQLAKARREVAMLHRREVLVLEEDHLVLEERAADLRDLLVVEAARQVGARDHRADGGVSVRVVILGHVCSAREKRGPELKTAGEAAQKGVAPHRISFPRPASKFREETPGKPGPPLNSSKSIESIV